MCVFDSAATCKNYVLTLWFKVPLVVSLQLRWQQGLETKQPDWNGPSYSPYWGRLPEICVGSSLVCQMDDQAGPGSAAASLRADAGIQGGRKWNSPHREIQPYGPSDVHWWVGHYTDIAGHRVGVSFTARNALIFSVWTKPLLRRKVWATDFWPWLLRETQNKVWA